tara:strand:- start:2404 stop:2628 length:225 start_codon:yes stop_codon:yes gene_type:complete
MRDKLGPYISQLMATIVDKEQDDFVKELAINELERLKVDLNSFLLKYIKNDDDTKSEETVKKLLQEEKNKQEEK